jgi:serine kinase of HPr protein (carbohydrate metabolism regulator)
MTGAETNLHATVIVAGRTGLLFVGPSGSGKSSTAFACLVEGRSLGLYTALVADDQVLVRRHADRLVARAPASIAGKMELRGSGIVSVETIDAAVLRFVIMPVDADSCERLPEDSERMMVHDGVSLPLLRIALQPGNPLARVQALVGDL